MQYKLSLFLCCILFASSSVPAAASLLRQKTVAGKPTLTIENAFFRMVIRPDSGGRIASLLDKRLRREMLYWNEQEALGGLLDDKGNTTRAPYESRVVTDTAQEAAVRLRVMEGNTTVTKTIRVSAGRPTFLVTYEIENAGQSDMDTAAMVRNFPRPGGSKLSDKWIYSYPMTGGVRAGSAADLFKYAEFRGKFIEDVAAPWCALADKASGQGLAVSFDGVKWFYNWLDSDEYPTYEWLFGSLPAGKKLTTRLWIAVTHGLVGASDVTRDYALKTVTQAAGQGLVIKSSLLPTWDPLKAARIHTTLCDLNRRPLAQFPNLDIRLGSVPVGGLKSGQARAALLSPGTYVLRQEVFDGNRKLGDCEDAVIIGQSGGAYKRAPVPQKAVLEDLPRWVKEKPFAPRPSPADQARGYVVYRREGQDAGKPCQGLEFNLARNGRESQAVCVLSLKDKLEITAAVEPNAKLQPGQIQARIEEGVTVPPYAGITGTGYVLRDEPAFAAEPNVERKVWLTVKGQNSDPGTYEAALTLTPKTGDPLRIPVKINVYDVTLPARKLVSLECEHLFQTFPQQAWDAYARDLAEHGVDVLQVYPLASDSFYAKVLVKGSGQTLSEALQNPDFKKGPFPELDFSYYDGMLATARKYGLVRFASYETQLDSEVNAPINLWYWREWAKYLRSRGYGPEDILCKVLDEQPYDHFEAMAEHMRILKQAGWRPYSTFSTVFRYPKWTKLIDPVCDMWQLGGVNPADWQARLADGSLGKKDEVWAYTGTGTYMQSYAMMRAQGWTTAYSGLRGFHDHEYYRWAQACAIIVPTDSGPIDSPAWEGLADGMEDAQYWTMLRQETHALKAKANPAQRKVVDARLAAIAGPDANSLLRFGVVNAERLTMQALLNEQGDFAGQGFRTARKETLAWLEELE